MRDSIIKNISQLFLIIFSVVLGILLSERIEEQKNKKEALKLLSKITAEVNDNKMLLEEWAPYHAGIARGLDTLSSDDVFIDAFINDKSILFRKVLTAGTFMRRTPSSDAWDIAKSHPLIVNFDYDELLILSRIYNQQHTTFEPLQKIFDIALSPDFNAAADAKYNLQKFNNLMQEFVSREVQLIYYFNEAEEIFNLQHNEE